MIRAPITLRHATADAAEHKPAARFIPGGDASAWLDELLRWRVPLAALELFVIPTSATGRTPAGVLVNLNLAGAVPAESARSLPYDVVADRLFVPIDAALSPPVTDAEWTELLSGGMAAFVWHPAVGLVGVEPADVLRVSDLLAPPTLRNADWNRAHPGLTFNGSLHAVRAPDPPTLADIFESGQDDIGTHARDLDELDPKLGPAVQGAAAALGRLALAPFRQLRDALRSQASADDADDADNPQASKEAQPQSGVSPEAGEQLRRLGQALGRTARGVARLALTPAAYLAREFARHAPATASQPTWVNGLEGWANRMLAAGADLWDSRRREMRRLLDLLESDPDAGLRYALPVGGQAHRGLALPSGTLGTRRVDFNLGDLGGGGAADFWNIPPDTTAALIERYRQLAEREVRLQRYRRAAYIYAQLLGDLNRAAGTLEQGGFLREAAVLYREKLNRPWDAARCLERAGLFEEAVEIYEQLAAFEKIGDLYRQLERPEEAAAAYEEAVNRHLAHDEHSKAAALLEGRLDNPAGALAVLQSGWPASPQARKCLDESFRLMARMGRHDLALESVRRLRTDDQPEQCVRPLVETLVETAGTYPDERVRMATADAARVVTSRSLVVRRPDPTALLAAVGRLAPQDRLLARDCQRYGTTPPPAPKKQAVPSSPPARTGRERFLPKCVDRIELPPHVHWQVARSTLRGYYLFGWRDRELILVRGSWADPEHRLAMAAWTSPALRRGSPLLVAVREQVRPAVAVLPVGGPPLPYHHLQARPAFPEVADAGTPGWLEDGALAVDTVSQSIAWTVALTETGLSVTAVGPGGELLSNFGSYLGPAFAPPEDRFAVPMHARPEGLFLGFGHDLVHIPTPAGDASQTELVHFPGPIRSIVGSAAHTLPRLCVLHESGGVVIWGGARFETAHQLAEELTDPVAHFLTDGSLVVASRHSWQLYSTANRELRLLGGFDTPSDGSAPVALLPTAWPDRVAVCPSQGHLSIYRIPKE